MIVDLHPVWVWGPFMATTSVVLLVLIGAPREKRTFPLVALVGFAWLWSAWLVGARYPQIQSWAWIPILSTMAVLLMWGLVYLNRMITRHMKQRSGRDSGDASLHRHDGGPGPQSACGDG